MASIRYSDGEDRHGAAGSKRHLLLERRSASIVDQSNAGFPGAGQFLHLQIRDECV
jgi:hypothetical protein